MKPIAPQTKRRLETLFTVLIAVVAPITLALWTHLSQKPLPPLESEMFQTLQAMEKSSYDAMQSMSKASELLRDLEQVAAKRKAAIDQLEGTLNALQNQRSLLDLTPEQRKGLEQLITKRRSVTDILWSRDFWLQTMLPSAFFCIVGILIQPRIARWKQRRPHSPRN